MTGNYLNIEIIREIIDPKMDFARNKDLNVWVKLHGGKNVKKGWIAVIA